ncbi:hypothetical protein CLF_112140 [Clonorchis sinensis]|uniref:Uncharacterized protein n=1 Tax=Clonorchis sinensis TaxID=79923 RepID=G7YMA5_CLOSI|nr:hypothetical protein CLF_112140 [Clonorchis sinensis]
MTCRPTSIVWFLLIFITWPLALFVAGWYIFFSVLAPCYQTCQSITDLVFKILMLPNTCVRKMLGQNKAYDSVGQSAIDREE